MKRHAICYFCFPDIWRCVAIFSSDMVVKLIGNNWFPAGRVLIRNVCDRHPDFWPTVAAGFPFREVLRPPLHSAFQSWSVFAGMFQHITCWQRESWLCKKALQRGTAAKICARRSRHITYIYICIHILLYYIILYYIILYYIILYYIILYYIILYYIILYYIILYYIILYYIILYYIILYYIILYYIILYYIILYYIIFYYILLYFIILYYIILYYIILYYIILYYIILYYIIWHNYMETSIKLTWGINASEIFWSDQVKKLDPTFSSQPYFDATALAWSNIILSDVASDFLVSQSLQIQIGYNRLLSIPILYPYPKSPLQWRAWVPQPGGRRTCNFSTGMVSKIVHTFNQLLICTSFCCLYTCKHAWQGSCRLWGTVGLVDIGAATWESIWAIKVAKWSALDQLRPEKVMLGVPCLHLSCRCRGTPLSFPLVILSDIYPSFVCDFGRRIRCPFDEFLTVYFCAVWFWEIGIWEVHEYEKKIFHGPSER